MFSIFTNAFVMWMHRIRKCRAGVPGTMFNSVSITIWIKANFFFPVSGGNEIL